MPGRPLPGTTAGRVLAEIEDGVGLVTFRNPDRLNAMSVSMWRDLESVLDAFERDDSVRVVVLTGAGSKAFVSGADVSEFGQARSTTEARREYDVLTRSGRERLAGFGKVVIARIRGVCLGGGLGIALQADIRIAAVDSSFGMTAPRLGIATGYDIVRMLVATVGPVHASELLLTGTRITGAEAARIGLVNRVVADEDLSDTVVDLARTVADNAPLSARAAKVCVRASLPELTEAQRLACEAVVNRCADSADYEEGVAAFKERRRPVFQGR